MSSASGRLAAAVTVTIVASDANGSMLDGYPGGSTPPTDRPRLGVASLQPSAAQPESDCGHPLRGALAGAERHRLASPASAACNIREHTVPRSASEYPSCLAQLNRQPMTSALSPQLRRELLASRADMAARGCPHGSLAVTEPSGRTTTFGGREPGPNAHITIVRLAYHWPVARQRRMLALPRPTGRGFCYARSGGGVELGDEQRTCHVSHLEWHLARPFSRARCSISCVATHPLAADATSRPTMIWEMSSMRIGSIDGMNYSSALFERPGQSLEDAQAAKLDRIIALLAPGTRRQGAGNRLRLGTAGRAPCGPCRMRYYRVYAVACAIGPRQATGGRP